MERIQSSVQPYEIRLSPLTAPRQGGIEGNPAGNPFWDPEVALAAKPLRPTSELFWLETKCAGACVFAVACTIKRFAGRRFLYVWQHDLAPLAEPHMICVATQSAQLASALHDFLKAQKFSALIICNLPLDSPFATIVKRWRGSPAQRIYVTAKRRRAWLRKVWQANTHLSKRRFKEWQRLYRKSGLVHQVLEGDFSWRAPFQRFLHLEAAGWKGKAGTALSQQPEQLRFAKTLLDHHHRQGRLRMDLLTQGTEDGTDIAACLISFVHEGQGVIWKMAHDPSLSKWSPGWQLLVAMSHQISQQTNTLAIDSLASPDHDLINRLWPGRRTMLDVVLPVENQHVPAAMAALLLWGIAQLRSTKRALKRLRLPQ